MGIEPTSEAWEASILPLYDARSFTNLANRPCTRKHLRPQCGPRKCCAGQTMGQQYEHYLL
jgi:hypothetical protein